MATNALQNQHQCAYEPSKQKVSITVHHYNLSMEAFVCTHVDTLLMHHDACMRTILAPHVATRKLSYLNSSWDGRRGGCRPSCGEPGHREPRGRRTILWLGRQDRKEISVGFLFRLWALGTYAPYLSRSLGPKSSNIWALLLIQCLSVRYCESGCPDALKEIQRTSALQNLQHQS